MSIKNWIKAISGIFIASTLGGCETAKLYGPPPPEPLDPQINEDILRKAIEKLDTGTVENDDDNNPSYINQSAGSNSNTNDSVDPQLSKDSKEDGLSGPCNPSSFKSFCDEAGFYECDKQKNIITYVSCTGHEKCFKFDDDRDPICSVVVFDYYPRSDIMVYQECLSESNSEIICTNEEKDEITEDVGGFLYEKKCRKNQGDGKLYKPYRIDADEIGKKCYGTCLSPTSCLLEADKNKLIKKLQSSKSCSEKPDGGYCTSINDINLIYYCEEGGVKDSISICRHDTPYCIEENDKSRTYCSRTSETDDKEFDKLLDCSMKPDGIYCANNKEFTYSYQCKNNMIDDKVLCPEHFRYCDEKVSEKESALLGCTNLIHSDDFPCDDKDDGYYCIEKDGSSWRYRCNEHKTDMSYFKPMKCEGVTPYCVNGQCEFRKYLETE